MTGLEQQRRDFKAAQPDLYAYISAVETAKALNSAGDVASGAADQFGAANRIWARSAEARQRAKALCGETQQ